MRRILIGFLLATAIAQPSVALAMQFPSMQSENLNQRQVSLPAEFDSRRNIVFVAYEQNQQAAVDSWFGFVDEAQATYGDVDYFELPTVGSGMRLMKGFLDGVMREGIPDVNKRERTITLYTNVRRFQQSLGLSDTNAIDVLVVDANGTVHAKTRGPYSAANAEVIAAALK